MRAHPEAPESLWPRLALETLRGLELGRRVVLVAPPGAGRTAVASAYASGFGGPVLWGRPDVEPVGAMLNRWSAQLGLEPPEAVTAPRQVQDWARQALQGRAALVVLDAVPKAEQARVHALVVDGPTFVFVADSADGWRAEPVLLQPLGVDAAAAWLAAVGAGLPAAATRRAAAALAADAPSLALLGHLLKTLPQAVAGALCEGLDGCDSPAEPVLDAALRSWGDDALWPGLCPTAGMDAATIAGGPDGAARAWSDAGLLTDMGDGLRALPPSLWARLRSRAPSDALRRRYVAHVVADPSSSIEAHQAAVESAGALEDGEALAALVGRIIAPMMRAGHGFELLRLVGTWGKVAKLNADLHAQAVVKREQGEIFAALGHLPQALEFFATAVALADECGAASLGALAMAGQARVNQALDRQEVALGQFRDARARFEAVDDSPGLMMALGGLATALVAARQLEEAVGVFRQLAGLCGALGDGHGQVHNLRQEGVALLKLGALEAALEPLNAARAGAHALGDTQSEATCLKALGICHSDLRRLDEAEAAWSALAPLMAAAQDLAGEILCARELAAVAGLRGDTKAQLAHLEGARLKARAQLNAQTEAQIIGDIARLHIARGDLEAAIATYEGQAQAAASGGMTEVAATALAAVAPLLKQAGREAEAREMLQEMRRRLRMDGGKALGIIDGALFRLAGG